MSIAIPSGYFATTADADTVADGMFGVSAYLSAVDQVKANAIVQACTDIDRGMRYQGRKYDPTQTSEFPRVAYDSSKRLTMGLGLGPVGPIGPEGPEVFGLGVEIWDWDYINGVAVIPQYVLMAVIFQASSLIAGKRAERLDVIHDGVRGQGAGPLREDYGSPDRSGKTVLSRQAFIRCQRYRLAGGRII